MYVTSISLRMVTILEYNIINKSIMTSTLFFTYYRYDIFNPSFLSRFQKLNHSQTWNSSFQHSHYCLKIVEIFFCLQNERYSFIFNEPYELLFKYCMLPYTAFYFRYKFLNLYFDLIRKQMAVDIQSLFYKLN